MTEAKRIDIKKGSFMANGHLYKIMIDQITVSRYEIYEKLALEVGFGFTFEEVFATLKKIYEAATTGESPLKALHETSVLAMNQLHGIKKFEEREHPTVLKFCSIFINREDENLESWDEQLADKKIHDWTTEGIAMQDFFFLSSSAIKGFLDAFQVTAILPEVKSKSQSSSSTT